MRNTTTPEQLSGDLFDRGAAIVPLPGIRGPAMIDRSDYPDQPGFKVSGPSEQAAAAVATRSSAQRHRKRARRNHRRRGR
jgi:hypothetical protein